MRSGTAYLIASIALFSYGHWIGGAVCLLCAILDAQS